MMTAFKNWLVAPLAISIVAGMTASASAQLISFEYTQTDKDTGSGTLSGRVDGVEYTGVMPQATVTQVDSNNLPLPEGYIGYMDGWQESQPGNPFGVHLGWSGEVTLTGSKVISPTTLQLFELDLPLILDQAADAEWRYETVLTDDGKGNGNDAFGTSLRIAGWIGDLADGHRHSAGAFGTFVEGAVDTVTVVGTHGDIGEFGRGDALGIAISLRNANGTSGPSTFVDDGDGTGPIYVDNLIWQGGFTVDPATATIRLVGTSLAADFNGDGNVDLADFLILSSHYNLDGTTRVGGGDMTGDGRTDVRDFTLFREAFNAAAGATAASVPEPGTACSLLVAGLCLAASFRRRLRAETINMRAAS